MKPTMPIGLLLFTSTDPEPVLQAIEASQIQAFTEIEGVTSIHTVNGESYHSSTPMQTLIDGYSALVERATSR